MNNTNTNITNNTPIEEANFNLRTYNTLVRAGIHTIGDLISRTEQELSSVRNLSQACLSEIKEWIESNSLSLSGESAGGNEIVENTIADVTIPQAEQIFSSACVIQDDDCPSPDDLGDELYYKLAESHAIPFGALLMLTENEVRELPGFTEADAEKLIDIVHKGFREFATVSNGGLAALNARFEWARKYVEHNDDIP